MSTSINPISSGLFAADPTTASTASGTTTSSDSGLGATANMNTFLQLLVAQIKNQNPLNPTDGTQFVSQLAQFSELEQMIGVRSGVGAIQTDLEKALTTPQITDPTTTGTVPAA
jgi:flagellar basal-body rod modification protein FlgD